MTARTDRTAQVEKRVEAIIIQPRDGCAFFEKRETAPVSLRECWYCAHGDFPRDGGALHAPGLCKFRK